MCVYVCVYVRDLCKICKGSLLGGGEDGEGKEEGEKEERRRRRGVGGRGGEGGVGAGLYLNFFPLCPSIVPNLGSNCPRTKTIVPNSFCLFITCIYIVVKCIIYSLCYTHIATRY